MQIKEFSEIRMGHAFRERLEAVPGGRVAVIRPSDILQSGAVCFGSSEPVRTELAAVRPLKAGEVLVVNRGRFAATVFEGGEGEWIVPSSILVLTITSGAVLPEYVALYFNSGNGQNLFRRHSEQTTIPFISRGNLGNMEIPIPTLARQRVLIDFERSARVYAELTERKQELHKQILGHELVTAEQALKGIAQ